MTEKVCPRCGSMYEDLKSTTCPQCFAKLLVVDEATAEELRAAREAVERTPEFQAVKAEDDEKFREQSFGACLGVIVIALVTLIALIVLIGVAMHRRHHTPKPSQAVLRLQPPETAGSLDILTPLPVAAGSLDDVLPATIGPYQRQEADQNITLSGTLTPILHAVYSDNGKAIHVYAVPTSLPTALQNQFRQGVELAAQIETSGLTQVLAAPTQTFATEHWRYAIIGPAGSTADTRLILDDYRLALGIAHFRQLSR